MNSVHLSATLPRKQTSNHIRKRKMSAFHPHLSLSLLSTNKLLKKHKCKNVFQEQLKPCINLSDTDTISEHLPIAYITNRESVHINLSDTDTISEHLPIADIANRESIRINLSDTDTISEHLPIADIANRASIHMWEAQLSGLIHIAWQVHVCTPNKLCHFPFNT